MGKALSSKGLVTWPTIRQGRFRIGTSATTVRIGELTLYDYLRQTKLHTPLVVATLLDQQDWTGFEAAYKPLGRLAYSPRGVMGLIVYGVMQGITSLRGLERFARLDLGCLWVSSGITPDHASLGRFLLKHEAILSHDFFEALTRTILKQTNTSTTLLAGDGTLVEAACSRYRLLKAEAVRERLSQAQHCYEQSTEPTQAATQTLAVAQQCQTLMDQRAAARQRSGKDTASLCISPTEPEAALQKQKNGRGFAPAYTPSVWANTARIIVAHALDTTQETRVLPTLWAQSQRITPVEQPTLLLDSGYFQNEVFQLAIENNIDVLCPPKPSTEGKGLYHKFQFTYDETKEGYYCPAGQFLKRLDQVNASTQSRATVRYGQAPCSNCPQRAQCTTAQTGRKIKCYPEDEVRWAMHAVMRQPKAKRLFKQRKAMVEPVFATLRQQQRFSRFLRRGLRGAYLEFTLQVIAYNLTRAAILLGGIENAIYRMSAWLTRTQGDSITLLCLINGFTGNLSKSRRFSRQPL